MTSKKIEIKTIDVQAKQWFDKTYGNTYSAVQTTLNFGMPDQTRLFTIWQSGSHWEQMAMETLRATFPEIDPDKQNPLWKYCQDNGIILRRNVQDKCTKREIMDWGNGIEFGC